MGVSADTGGLDLTALLSNPDALSKRVGELRFAQQAYEKAFNDLNIGKQAADIIQQANRKFDEAKQTLSDANDEANSILLEARKKADVIIADATASAESKLASLRDKIERAEEALVVAERDLEQARKDADSLMVKANRLFSDNKNRADELDKKMADASARMAAADRAKASYQSACNYLIDAIDKAKTIAGG